MKKIMHWLASPPVYGPASILLIRFMAGSVFLWEGILKFVYENQGIGRFTKLGMPLPELTATFVGSLEIVGGLLVIFGLMTRLIAVPFILEMIVAMLSTKISLYLGTSPLPLPSSPPQVGVWAVLHEIRSEFAQISCMLFLLINGPGCASFDAYWTSIRITPRLVAGPALPAPGSVPKKAPIPWDPAHPFQGLGFRSVEEESRKISEIKEWPVVKG